MKLEEAKQCAHRDSIQLKPRPAHPVCEECVKLGDHWVHLRQCQSCGKVGCCDSSKNQHATKHFERSGHPIVRSMEDGWYWCYVDEIIL